MKVKVQIDREEPITFGFKSEANEYLDDIRKSGRYYYKIKINEGEKETTFLKHLSSVCVEIMKSAATTEGVLIDISLDKDGEMTLVQKIVSKLELEGLIEENEFVGKDLVHRLTKKGLSFYNDYKALAWLRKRKKVKKYTNDKREIYNINKSIY